MKTAVEWLEENLLSEPWAEEHFKHNLECWDKAKEMEKERIVDAIIYGNAKPSMVSSKILGEQYYNETYKSKQ